MIRALLVSTLCALAVGCSGQDETLTVEFASQDALDQTRFLSVTAFEPFIRSADSDAFEFVGCRNVNTFGPVQRVNPDAIAVSNLVGRVLLDRESDTFPLGGDWRVSFDRPDETSESNPWGAVMVLLEARGDARAAGRGSGQVVATLASGCYCVRTVDTIVMTPELRDIDALVRDQCEFIDAPDGAQGDRLVELSPLTPPEFHLSVASGTTKLTSPKNSVMSPGPVVQVSADRCDNTIDQTDCFKCEEPRCEELQDKSNAPVLFKVVQPGGQSTPTSQVVLTDDEGRASATIEVDDCERPLLVEANIVGRPEESIAFEVSCVDPVDSFDCSSDSELAPGYEAVAISTIPGDATRCAPSNPSACDHVAVLYEDGVNSFLEVRGQAAVPTTTVAFPNLRAYTLHGFAYDASRTLLAVALAEPTPPHEARLFLYEWKDQKLYPHLDTGELIGRCDWYESCHSSLPCATNEDCGSSLEDCQSGTCRLKDPCWPTIEPQSRATIHNRDIDGDGRQDIAIANSSERPMAFFRSSDATGDELYAPTDCTCGRFGQTTTSFALGNFGGPTPNPAFADVVIGSAGGTYLRYVESTTDGFRLTCGAASSLKDSMSVRDVQAGNLSCPIGDQTCSAYDDAVVISATGLAGGSLDEPGFLRVFYGSSASVSGSEDILLKYPQVSLGITPRPLGDRGEPRDPRSAQLSDVNGDGHLDISVLFKASEELHVWLGASNRAFGETDSGITLDECDSNFLSSARCSPLPFFTTADLDGNGRSEIAIICDPMGASPRIRYYTPRAN